MHFLTSKYWAEIQMAPDATEVMKGGKWNGFPLFKPAEENFWELSDTLDMCREEFMKQVIVYQFYIEWEPYLTSFQSGQ